MEQNDHNGEVSVSISKQKVLSRVKNFLLNIMFHEKTGRMLNYVTL